MYTKIFAKVTNLSTSNFFITSNNIRSFNLKQVFTIRTKLFAKIKSCFGCQQEYLSLISIEMYNILVINN